MKTKSKLIAALICVFVISASGGAVSAFAEAQSYYVCFSTENYAVRNANKLVNDGGEYILKDVKLNALKDFFVTDNAGRRWYAADGKEMSVEESAEYSYNIKFSPDTVYSEAGTAWEKTDCNITYCFYVPAEYSVNIGSESVKLTYNPYHTGYDVYYISSVYIDAGAVVSYNGEEHAVQNAGYYRILFTDGERRGTADYAFDKNGAYGTGDGYIYKLYIEDAPQYYYMPYGGNEYLPLIRYENNVAASEYRGEEFFSGGRDYNFRYCVYEKDAGGNYRLIDDDNDGDTDISRITVPDAGWYELALTDGGNTFLARCVYTKKTFGGFYISGEFNNYNYDADGTPVPNEKYRLAQIDEDDPDYDEDFSQYSAELNVSESDLKDGDVEFFITDGGEIYKNGNEYITVSRAGKYKILFSDEHFYGNGRRYRYVLDGGQTEYTELEISTAGEFLSFAENCSKSADYSKNLAVYLTCDINFSGVSFKSAGEFSGRFYGGYHRLENITLTEDDNSVFKIIKRDGIVERLTVTLTANSSDADYSGFAGKNYGKISNVTVYGKITGDRYTGAVCGYNGRSAENESSGSADTDTVYRKGIIENCKNFAEVAGTVHCGGVCGFNAGEITSCENRGSVSHIKQSSSSTPFNLGGIAGYSAGRISGCHNYSAVNGGSESVYTGGICGLSTGEFYFCFNKAAVSARRYAGGVCGYFGTISQNNDNNDFFGGLTYEEIYQKYFGDNQDGFEEGDGDNKIIKYCKNSGAVTSVAYAGGILGFTDSAALKLTCSESVADVSVTAGSYAGGICGYSTGAQISDCITSGIIRAKGLNAGSYAGGICGYGNNITACSSVCEISGNDYLGGIAGYNQNNVSASWASVILLPDESAENVGNVCGFTEALNEAADSFSAGFKDNYYIENTGAGYGGIAKRSYGLNYDFAACPAESSDLAYTGTLSPYLSEGFVSCGRWQGAETLSYPVPRYLSEADECAEYGDDAEFLKLFNTYKQEFATVAEQNSQILYTVTFMEWNEDNGELIEDGKIQRDNFEPIYSVRLPLGSAVTLPDFKWAKPSQGKYIFEGKDASYFVSFPQITRVEGNAVIYAEYFEIVTTLATEDGAILAEGVFDIRTQVKLLQSVNGYSLEFTLDGKPLEVGEIIVKFKPEGGVKNKKAVVFYGGERTENSEVSGEYLKFTYNDGCYFAVEPVGLSSLPAWAWALIGGGCGAAVAGAAVLTVFAVRRSKRRKAEAAKTKEAEEK